MLTIPGLPDLLLEPPVRDDAAAITRACQDPDIQGWTTVPVPYTTADALAFLDDVQRAIAAGEAWTWAIRESGRLVGMVGLERQPGRSAEIGYWLGPNERGRGVMSRAVAAVVEHAFDPRGLGLDRLGWQAYVGNWPSRRVAERVGFVVEGAVRGHALQRGSRRDAWVGTLLREDWADGAVAATPSNAAGSHLVLWRGLDTWRTEACEVRMCDDHLLASGTQLGADPVPYRVDYRLWTGPAFVTRRLDVVTTGHGWRRHLDLRRADDGSWSSTAGTDGHAPLPPPGGDPTALVRALDCDLARSPLTNTMPVLRHGLLGPTAPVDLLMAWVSVPDLGVHPSGQRYEHLDVGADGSARVRYKSEDRAFVRDITFGPDRLVSRYPGLAERIDGAARGEVGRDSGGVDE